MAFRSLLSLLDPTFAKLPTELDRSEWEGLRRKLARHLVQRRQADKRAGLEARPARFDQSSATGPWTRRTLQAIAASPGVVSTTLARRMGMDRQAFKINVRKLKELGLTESLDVGYRLSPLGDAFLSATPVG